MEWRSYPMGSKTGPLLLMHSGTEVARVDANAFGQLRLTVGRYRPPRLQHMRLVRSREEGKGQAEAWLVRYRERIEAEVEATVLGSVPVSG